MDQSTMKRMEELPDLQTFRLTNRIRTNAELSSFIQNMMHLPLRNQAKENLAFVIKGNETVYGILLDMKSTKH